MAVEKPPRRVALRRPLMKVTSARIVISCLSLLIAGSCFILWLALNNHFGDELPLLIAGVVGAAGVVGGILVLATFIVVREDV